MVYGTFTPKILSTTVGMEKEAYTFLKKLADNLFRILGQRYSKNLIFIRKRIRFDLLRTKISAFRGERGMKSGSAVNSGVTKGPTALTPLFVEVPS